LAQRYTRTEVGRILGVEPSRLRYWERLQLVHPQSRWGEHFYSFGDLVALKSLQRLTQNRIPARRVQRAVKLIEQQFGAASPLRLEELSLIEHGSEVLVIPPGGPRPFNPIRQQWAFSFDSPKHTPKLHAMAARTPEELFELALDCETQQESLPQAVDHYRRVIDLSPDWIDAHINLGVALYQLGQIEEAREEFQAAVQLDPLNGISRYNLGCVLEEQGEFTEAIDHLQRAARAMPAHPDVHFNLALAHEKRGERKLAREQWTLYLRYAPNGVWADQARLRLRQFSSRRKTPSAPIPFPQRG
jgi:tetratricopeptide (TPR) repeat protein